MPHVLSMFDSEFLHCYDLTKDQVEEILTIFQAEQEQ